MSRDLTYTIGPAAPEDVPHLPEIERRACDLFLSIPIIGNLPLVVTPPEHFTAAQRDGRLWVARIAGIPVGFALVERLDEAWHLEELDVLPQHGRRGIGRGLVTAVCDWAQAGGGGTLTLCTFKDVPWNAPFYERLGFRRLEPHECTPGVRARVHDEAQRGLPNDLRVAMRWSAAPGP